MQKQVQAMNNTVTGTLWSIGISRPISNQAIYQETASQIEEIMIDINMDGLSEDDGGKISIALWEGAE